MMAMVMMMETGCMFEVSLKNQNYIWKPKQHCTRLQVLADGPKLPARASNAKTPQSSSQFKFTVILAMNKSREHLDECFLDPRINKPFIVNQKFFIFKANQLPLTSPQQ